MAAHTVTAMSSNFPSAMLMMIDDDAVHRTRTGRLGLNCFFGGDFDFDFLY
jgi:hypothetical protein